MPQNRNIADILYFFFLMILPRIIYPVADSNGSDELDTHTTEANSLKRGVGVDNLAPPLVLESATRPSPDIDAIGHDMLNVVFGFLNWREVLKARVSRRWRDIATHVRVPPSSVTKKGKTLRGSAAYTSHDFQVNSETSYQTLVGLARVLPNLQQIQLGRLGYQDKFTDGEDSTPRIELMDDDEFSDVDDFNDDDEFSDEDDFYDIEREDVREHDVGIVAKFQQLRNLYIIDAPLNGRYPVIFNFPHLQKLHIDVPYLKWDLSMLKGLPRLEELVCLRDDRAIHGNDVCQEAVTGDVQSLRVLKFTLKTLKIARCVNVVGNLLNLADFPLLEDLDLHGTSVTGDLRSMQVHHFPKMKTLGLPDLEFHRIGDVPGSMDTIFSLKKRTPSLFRQKFWHLAKSSQDRYIGQSRGRTESTKEELNTKPPFTIEVVKAGPRLGWRWTNADPRELFRSDIESCEINWIDPAPDDLSEEYKMYTKGLQRLQQSVGLYKGLHKPPTQEKYNLLLGEHA
mmetsp:Transcript_9430/g.20406  ORF Transcript_9430/g.20406 Transcript_9430/m.20406 type:complete len:510 (+) Transcript_9430:16-1545(+)